jgi:hypothetical protein
MSGEKEFKAIVRKDGTIAIGRDAYEALGLKDGEVFKIVGQDRKFLHLKRDLGEEGDSGRVILSGIIEGFGIADLFSVLNMTQRTGVLTLRCKGMVKSIYFRKGEIVFASSNLPEDRIGYILYKTGKVSKESLEAAEKSMTRSIRFGALLLQKQLITPKNLWWGVKYQIEEIVYSVFNFDKGDFFFIEGDLAEEDLVKFSLNTQNLLMEGFRRLDEWKIIYESIPDKSTVLTVTGSAMNMEMSPPTQYVLKSIDGKADINELVRKSGIGEFNTYKILFQLMQNGAISVKGKEADKKVEETKDLEKMKDTISKYNQMFRIVFSELKAKSKIDVSKEFEAFKSELSEKLQKLFAGVKVGADGGVDPDKLLENVRSIRLADSGSFSRIAGLGEMFVSQLLLEGLNELLNFELFTIKNALQQADSDNLVKQIREFQRARPKG